LLWLYIEYRDVFLPFRKRIMELTMQVEVIHDLTDPRVFMGQGGSPIALPPYGTQNRNT
jgi:hypothetical protein